eukprot:scaffold12828_cov112-Isochrysis_galbana.AAC.8
MIRREHHLALSAFRRVIPHWQLGGCIRGDGCTPGEQQLGLRAPWKGSSMMRTCCPAGLDEEPHGTHQRR